ncbi:tyrosine-type recombinase/integrase [Methylotenera versatilis]|uniref:tyrosine-type recombinase/integrase n=1 Tax=Methylotenera versatilis TaxID=1055487 RepID=UPI000645E3C0|nr:site-specific integrase [Methylotenera versatilis]
MATIEKRKNSDGSTSYRVKIRLKGHPTESATFTRMTDARDWVQKTEADIKAGRHFGMSKLHTLSELLIEYKSSPAHIKLKSASYMKARLDWWHKTHGSKLLKDITPALIAKSRDQLLNEFLTVRKRGVDGLVTKVALEKRRSGATTNRFLAALSSACSYGVKELGWLERNPIERVTKLAESKGRVRFLDSDELPRFLLACRKHPDLYLAVLLSLTTGGRQSEVMSLRWGQIDLNAGRAMLQAGTTKNNDTKVMPLVGEALTLLQERAKVRNLSDDRIFPPTPASRKSAFLHLRKPFTTALSEAAISDFHWHDLRHTCASYLMMNGVSPLEISKILGHRTMAMVSRYAHLAPTRASEISNTLAKTLGVG